FSPVLEPQHGVVGIADNDHVPVCPCAPPLVHPKVEDVMQIDVRQQWRNYRPLRRSYLGLLPFPLFRHSRLQPFPDQAKDAPVRDTMLDKLLQPFVRNIIEKTTTVSVENPV